MMTRKEFAQLVAEGFARLPEKFRQKIRNLVFLVEDEPSEAVRKEIGLREGETLLGFYRGIPRTARGQEYGVGPTLPDAIIIYQKPTEEEAKLHLQDAVARSAKGGLRESKTRQGAGSHDGSRESFRAKTCAETGSPDASPDAFREAVREVVAETVWHEVGHYFGLDEAEVAEREKERGKCPPDP